jgi:hypothetical protein
VDGRLDPHRFKPFWLNFSQGVLTLGSGPSGCGAFFQNAAPTTTEPLYIGLLSWDSCVAYRGILASNCLQSVAVQQALAPRPGSLLHLSLHSLSSCLNEGTVCTVLAIIAQLWGSCMPQWAECIVFAARNFSDVFRSAPASFCRLPDEALLQVFACSDVHAQEIALFVALEAWAYACPPRVIAQADVLSASSPLPLPGSPQSRGATSVATALQHVRFPLMTAAEIARVQASPLFTEVPSLPGLLEEAREHERFLIGGDVLCPASAAPPSRERLPVVTGQSHGRMATGAAETTPSQGDGVPAAVQGDGVTAGTQGRALGEERVDEQCSRVPDGAAPQQAAASVPGHDPTVAALTGIDVSTPSSSSLSLNAAAQAQVMGTYKQCRMEERRPSGEPTALRSATLHTAGSSAMSQGEATVQAVSPTAAERSCADSGKQMCEPQQRPAAASALGLPATHAQHRRGDAGSVPPRLCNQTDLWRLWRAQPRCPPNVAELVYMHDGDKNGVMHYLGTGNGTRSHFVNPHRSGRVVVSSSSPFNRDSDPSQLVSRDYHSMSCALPGTHSQAFWAVCFDEGHRLSCALYSLRVNNTTDFPQSWCLQGSKRGGDWDTLHEVKEDRTFMRSGQWASWAVPQWRVPVFFPSFRLLMTAPTATGSLVFNVCRIEFYGYLM